MSAELYIEGERVDINKDISALITYSIDDVKDFSARSTSYSKTIVLEGTQNNNKILGHIFNIGSANDYNSGSKNIGYNFNASVSAKCVLFNNGIQVMSGGLRVLEIISHQNTIEYECAIHGNISSLSYKLAGKLLEELDFSEYNHTYSIQNILNSWDSEKGKGYTYPLIDYGAYSILKKDWDYRTLRPAFYVKEYLKKMFSTAGFTIDSKFFETDRFKSLIIPHNRKRLDRLGSGLADFKMNSQSSFYTIFFELTGNTNFESGFSFDYDDSAIFEKTLIPQPSLPIMNFNNYKYIGDAVNVNCSYKFSLQIQSAYARSTSFYLTKNGAKIIGSETYIPRQPFGGDGFENEVFQFNVSKSFTFDIATNDVIMFYFKTSTDAASGLPANGPEFYTLLLDRGQSSFLKFASSKNVFIPISIGENIVAQDTVARNIKQTDFLLSIVKLFNLYVIEDQFNDKVIKIEPYVDFYSTNSHDAIEWTYRVDRDSPIRITPMSELNSKIYNFKYAEEGDFYNDLYKKRYNKGYGDYKFDSQFEFATNEDSLSLIFAATPLVGYDGEAKVYPTIFKKSGTVEEQIDSVIRIMLSKKIEGVPSWAIMDGTTGLFQTSHYMYSGHLDNPDNPDNNLNFGVSEEFFFKLVIGNVTKTQFNLYWSSYMAEITDKDSRLIKCKAYLKPIEIAQLDFSKYIYLDGVLFRLNKIVDYNASIPDLCTLELLKVINTTYTESNPNPNETYFLIDNDNGYLLDIDGGKIYHGN